MNFALGTKLDPYEILAPVGAGGIEGARRVSRGWRVGDQVKN